MSRQSDEDDSQRYKVVVNDEEQYSIAFETAANPPGWRDAGKAGLKAECLDYITTVWTDMRPLSLRRQMEEFARQGPPAPEPEGPMEPEEPSLVQRLCEGSHAVEVGLRPARTPQLFKDVLDRDYVHIKFTGTRGGTELGVRLDRDASDLSRADFAAGEGMVHLEGTLTLDYVKVRCIADIDVRKLAGEGRLVAVGAASSPRPVPLHGSAISPHEDVSARR